MTIIAAANFQPGDLVKITRAGVGIPLGSVGLIMETHTPSNPHILGSSGDGEQLFYYDIRICDKNYRLIRRLARDLELIHGNR